MISYRLTLSKDWPDIILLSNQIFQEKIPMEKSFPFLFNSSNPFSYVALDKDKIIGFIGVLPEELRVCDKTYYGSRIGAVCVSNEYQNQGIGRSLFRIMKNELVTDFIIVSGQGKLYLQEGCELFGDFEEFLIPPKNSNLIINQFTGSLKQLTKIHQLLQEKESYFVKSVRELHAFLSAHSLQNLWQGKQKVYLVYQNKDISGVIITCTRLKNNKEITEVLEYGGNAELLVEALQQIANDTPNLIFRTSKENQIAQSLKKIAKASHVQNAGTCLFINEKIREIDIPYTWDLAFL